MRTSPDLLHVAEYSPLYTWSCLHLSHGASRKMFCPSTAAGSQSRAYFLQELGLREDSNSRQVPLLYTILARLQQQQRTNTTPAAPVCPSMRLFLFPHASFLRPCSFWLPLRRSIIPSRASPHTRPHIPCAPHTCLTSRAPPCCRNLRSTTRGTQARHSR